MEVVTPWVVGLSRRSRKGSWLSLFKAWIVNSQRTSEGREIARRLGREQLEKVFSRLRRSCARLDKTAMLRRLPRAKPVFFFSFFYFLLPPPLPPLRWRPINPLRFIFYHPRSTYFQEKIEGLWTGYIALGPKPPLVTQIARTGLGTMLPIQQQQQQQQQRKQQFIKVFPFT